MASKSNVSRRKRKPKKPQKPYPEFPLYAHASGRWAKKIRGKLHYFGKWDDTEAALQKYLDQRDDLHAGRTPRNTGDGLTVAYLCNSFLTAKQDLLNNDELRIRTFTDYYGSCERLVSELGRNRLVDDLAADDFAYLRSSMAKSRGPVALGNEIQRARSVFKFAYDNGLIDKPIRYGQAFQKPSKKTIRKARSINSKKMLEAKELRKLIEAGSRPLKAMILLGVNCGFGNTDVSSLPKTAISLNRGWIDYARIKTGVERRCPLWPETVEALREAIEKRPVPKNSGDDDLVFLTANGNRWVKISSGKKQAWVDAVGLQFGKLLRKLDLKQPGLNFYALRHTFETIGGESKDQVAVNAIMGHVDNSMAGVYRERISDERLMAVTDTVREWLWGT